MQSILNNPEAVEELQKYLPSEGSDSGNQEENLRNTLACPQFQQVNILTCFALPPAADKLALCLQYFVEL